MKIAIPYHRFSTVEQKKGGSLERQRLLTTQHIKHNGWTCGPEILDAGLSGFKGHHRAPDAALGAFENEAALGLHHGKILVVERMDRLSRLDPETTYLMIKRFVDNGVSLAVADGSRFYGAGKPIAIFDLITLLMDADKSNAESKKTSERLKHRWMQRRDKAKKDGTLVRGSAPAWIRAGTSGKPLVIKDRAAMVRRWFEMSDDGIGTGEIAMMMERERVKPWGRSKTWQRTFISKTLSNRAVIGEYQPNHVVDGKRVPIGDPWPNHFPAIIDHDLFARVGRAASGRKAMMGGRASERLSNLFAGLMRCMVCGGKMYYKTDCHAGIEKLNTRNGKRYEVKRDRGSILCRTAKDSGGRKCDNTAAWAYLSFEDAMVKALLPLAMDDRAFMNQAGVSKLRVTIAEMTDRLTTLRKRSGTLWAAYGDDASDGAKKVAMATDAQITALEIDLADAQSKFDEAAGRASAADHIKRVKDIAADLHHDDLTIRVPLRRKVMISFHGLIDGISMDHEYAIVQMSAGILMLDRKCNVMGAPCEISDPTVKERLDRMIQEGNSPFPRHGKDGRHSAVFVTNAEEFEKAIG